MRVFNEEQAKGNYVIAGGDFNQFFPIENRDDYPVFTGTWQLGELDPLSMAGVQIVTDGSTPTCRSLDRPYIGTDRSQHQHYVIDGFLLSDNLAVRNVQTQDLGFKASDHNPVVLTVMLKAN